MLRNKHIVITGASSGIGQAIARAAAQEQACLHLLGRDRARLEQIKEELQGTAAQVNGYAFDLSDDRQVENFAAKLTQVDCLIHSAGVVKLAPLATAKLTDLEKQFQVNVRAPYLLTQLLLEQLIAVKGDIVFINSGAGLRANANWSQYAASKFALRAIADSLRAEVQAQGVRVLSVYPGRTASPMQEQVRAMEGQPYQAEELIQPEDIAVQVITTLSLPATATITDVSIRPGT